MQEPQPYTLTQVIAHLHVALDDKEAGSSTLGAFTKALEERGFGFMLLIFALPAALPAPGLNTVLALPLLFLTAQQVLGFTHVWLPQKMAHLTLPSKFMKKSMEMSVPYLRWLEKFLHPRLFFVTSSWGMRLTGIAGCIMALATCMPIPLTHTVPAIGIALMAIGGMTRDGLAVLGGIVIGLGWIGSLLGIAIAGILFLF